MQIKLGKFEIRTADKEQQKPQEKTPEQKENSLNVSIEIGRLKTDDKNKFIKNNIEETELFMLNKTVFNKQNFPDGQKGLLNFMKDLLKDYKGTVPVSQKSINTTKKYGFEFQTLYKKYLE